MKRFIRFLVAGGFNTLFGFVIYGVAIINEAAVWGALLASSIAGIVFNFITTGGYVFRELSPARFPRFIICYLIVYGINLELLELQSMWLNDKNLPQFILVFPWLNYFPWLNDKTLSQFILIFPMAVLSYLLMARFVFSKNKVA